MADTTTLTRARDRKVGETATFTELGGYINGDMAGVRDSDFGKVDMPDIVAAIIYADKLAAAGHPDAIPGVILVGGESDTVRAAEDRETWAYLLPEGYNGGPVLDEDSVFIRIN